MLTSFSVPSNKDVKIGPDALTEIFVARPMLLGALYTTSTTCSSL
jgi:hypothetical protein